MLLVNFLPFLLATLFKHPWDGYLAATTAAPVQFAEVVEISGMLGQDLTIAGREISVGVEKVAV